MKNTIVILASVFILVSLVGTKDFSQVGDLLVSVNEEGRENIYLWVTDKKDEDFIFRIDIDGHFEFDIWLVDKQGLDIVTITVNGKQVFSGKAKAESSNYWKAGTIVVPKGTHVIGIEGADLTRILLSNDKSVVASGKADLLWENRDAVRPFERLFLA